MDDWPVRLRRAVAQQMESLRASGIAQLPQPPMVSTASAVATEAEATNPSSGEAVDKPVASPHPAAPRSEPAVEDTRRSVTVQQATALLAELQQEVADCRKCEELACTRTQTVFGVGPANPRLCFFGEAPGYDEDRQGEPFVGAAGQLLTDIIEKGMGLRREEVYILNVLKCRPPGNRNPQPDEIENCRGFFEQQLAILQPEFICCLGAFAARTLLDTQDSVGRLRGRFHQYQSGLVDARVVVTYHPAYLLRNVDEKRKTWQDIKMLMGAMEIGTAG